MTWVLQLTYDLKFSDNVCLKEERVNIFTRGPYRAFICVSRVRFNSNTNLGLKTGLRGTDVALLD